MTKEEYIMYLGVVSATVRETGVDLEVFITDPMDPARYAAIIAFGTIGGKKGRFGSPDDLEQDLKKIEEQLKGNTNE